MAWSKDKAREYHRKYREKNRQKIREYQREYQREYRKKWEEENKEKVNDYYKKRRQQDPVLKLRHNVGAAIRDALKRADGSKNGESVMQHLPYTIDELREHLESQWEEGMTWDNHARDGWHIDHIVPQAALPYDSMEHPNFLECWKLENLQPLWAKDNLAKSDKIINADKELSKL